MELCPSSFTDSHRKCSVAVQKASGYYEFCKILAEGTRVLRLWVKVNHEERVRFICCLLVQLKELCYANLAPKLFCNLQQFSLALCLAENVLMRKQRICTSEVDPSSVSWTPMVNLRVTALWMTVNPSILAIPVAVAFKAVSKAMANSANVA